MRLLIVGISTLLLMSPTYVFSQEQPVEAADGETEQVESTASDSSDAATERLDEIDALEPGVPSQVLVAETRPVTATPGVMDELDLGRTEITGNQELPKVLYIVPWKKSDPGDLMGRPANTLLDDVLAPVDRGEFVREVGYYRDLFDETEEQ
ncbi:MAG: hypothetical protein AAGA44_17845 [Pseudomonadota bacterium]